MAYQASAFHGGLARQEMVPFIPEGAASVLDVGCSRGRFGASLRAAGHRARLVGIEPDPAAAGEAAPHYDEVVVGFYPHDLPREARYDCVVFNDVLEHVTDPWSVVAATLHHVAPGGRVVASIPNVRFVAVVRDLALRGRWDYTDWGILDRTHLRFFTRASIEELFSHNGFAVTRIEPINPITSLKARLLAGRFSDMRYQQFAVVAEPAGG